MSKLALQLTCYNGSRYLPFLFTSIQSQTYKDWTFFVLDNGSNLDEALNIKEAVQRAEIPIELKRVEETLDFVRGHNELFKQHTCPYIQLLNDDAMLEPDYLEKLIFYIENNLQVGAVSGRIYWWNFEQATTSTQGKTDRIDTCGFKKYVYGKVADRFTGLSKNALPILRLEEEVFGVSGCLPLYRRQAVIETSPDQTLFDPDFDSYKEDVELAYRFKKNGWKSMVLHEAIAYHNRSFFRHSHRQQKISTQLRSYRNHLWILFMHLSFIDWIKYGWAIIPFELVKIVYWFVYQPKIIFETFKQTKTGKI